MVEDFLAKLKASFTFEFLIHLSCLRGLHDILVKDNLGVSILKRFYFCAFVKKKVSI